MDSKEISYKDFVTVQSQIVDWFNNTLPEIKDFPVSTITVQQTQAGKGNSLAIAFPPSAINYAADMVGDYIKTSFMLSYKTATFDSNDRLGAIKVLQYLLDEIKKLNIVLGHDKIVIGFDGTLTPGIQDVNESESTSTYNALYELDYKHIRRF